MIQLRADLQESTSHSRCRLTVATSQLDELKPKPPKELRNELLELWLEIMRSERWSVARSPFRTCLSFSTKGLKAVEGYKNDFFKEKEVKNRNSTSHC